MYISKVKISEKTFVEAKKIDVWRSVLMFIAQQENVDFRDLFKDGEELHEDCFQDAERIVFIGAQSLNIVVVNCTENESPKRYKDYNSTYNNL